MFDPGLMDMIMRLRGRGISDNRVLQAIEKTPRKQFVGANFYLSAYEERSLPIDCGQTLSEPLAIARMTLLLDVKDGHKVLEVGTGSGYHTAILSQLCKRVYSVERYRLLIDSAEKRFKKQERHNIVVRHGDGRYGWKGQSPFDRVLVTAGLKSAPKGLIEQLKPGGVFVGVVKDQLVRLTKTETGIHEEIILPMVIPMIETGKSKAL